MKKNALIMAFLAAAATVIACGNSASAAPAPAGAAKDKAVAAKAVEKEAAKKRAARTARASSSLEIVKSVAGSLPVVGHVMGVAQAVHDGSLKAALTHPLTKEERFYLSVRNDRPSGVSEWAKDGSFNPFPADYDRLQNTNPAAFNACVRGGYQLAGRARIVLGAGSNVGGLAGWLGFASSKVTWPLFTASAAVEYLAPGGIVHGCKMATGTPSNKGSGAKVVKLKRAAPAVAVGNKRPVYRAVGSGYGRVAQAHRAAA